MLPDDVRVVLQLDGLAERERHRRRAQAELGKTAQLEGLPPEPMSALGGSGHAARKEESGFDPELPLQTAYYCIARGSLMLAALSIVLVL